MFVKKGEIVPWGFSLIDQSLGGSAECMFSSGYLAIKRANISSSLGYIIGENVIDDISAMVEDEELPEGYDIIPQSSSHVSHHSEYHTSFCFHSRGALGICNLTYEYSTIDRYPHIDRKGVELPSNELPMFAFPQGIHLQYLPRQGYPLPTFFTFVFTDIKGDHLYVACMRFYEIVPRGEVLSLYHALHSLHSPHGIDFDLPDDAEVFCPKVICVVSRNPYFRYKYFYLLFLKNTISTVLLSLFCFCLYLLSEMI